MPVKKAILAEAKAPREVRRRQIRHGTGHMHKDLPSASELSKARKAIFERGKCCVIPFICSDVTVVKSCSCGLFFLLIYRYFCA